MMRAFALTAAFLAVSVPCHAFDLKKALPAAKPAAPAAAASNVTLTPAEDSKFREWQHYLDDPAQGYYAYPKDMCGKNIPTVIDKALVPSFVKSGNNLELYCEEFRTKLSTMCRNDEEALHNGNKAKINAKVKRIVCRMGSKPDDLRLNLTPGGDLEIFMGPKSTNLSEAVPPFFEQLK